MSANSTTDWRNTSPTDAQLLQVVKAAPTKWKQLALSLGVPMGRIGAFVDDHRNSEMAGLHSLAYWRDGRCQKNIPITWNYLMEKIEKECGRVVADTLKRDIFGEEEQQSVQGTSTDSTVESHVGSVPAVAVSADGVRHRRTAAHSQSEISPLNNVITTTADLLPYVKGLVAHLTLLGSVLGIEDRAKAIENGPEDATAKCLNILKHWLEVTEHSTWNLFCSKLKKDATFNHVRFQIQGRVGNPSDDQLESHHQSPPEHQQQSPKVRPKKASKYSARCKCVSWTAAGVVSMISLIVLSYLAYCKYNSYVNSDQQCEATTTESVHAEDYVAESLTDGHKTDTTQPPSTSHEVPTSEPPQSTSHEVPTSEPPQSTSHKVPTSKSTKSPLPNSSQKEESETKDSKLTLEDFDSLSPHNLTEDEFNNLLQQFDVKEECRVWMELGVTGAEKSCLGNFILGRNNVFPESEIILKAKTQNASMESTTFDGEKLCVIDTPGLGDTLRLGKHKSKAMDVAEDASYLITELTKMMLMTKQGINAFLIVVPLHHRDYAGLQQLLDFFDILGHYWDHSVIVFTHGKTVGSTEEDQYKTMNYLLTEDPECPLILKSLVEKVNHRFVIAEAKEWRSNTDYRYRVVSKIRTFSDAITKQHGRYQDNLQSIGNEALEKAKLQLRHIFEDLESPEAKAAIFQSTFQHVREVVYKLVKIKLADGEDVDKLKEMAEVKEKELSDIRKQRDLLREEFLEEQKRRREAEEEQRRLAEEKQKEEDRRKQAEEEKRREAERRRKAEEERLREQREKEEAQRKLEEYLKKPTFNERRVEAHVYKSNIYRWKYAHSAEARDVATGITAKAKNYESKGGAIEHAKLNLKAILLEKGVIRKDDI